MRAVDAVLKKQKRTAKNFPAMPYTELPSLMTKLQESGGVGALALQFAFLTAARSGEVRGATWSEIDIESATWTIPAERMKAGEEHIVAVSKPVMAILKTARLLSDGGPDANIFPGQRRRPLSDMTLTKALRSAGCHAFTVLGM